MRGDLLPIIATWKENGQNEKSKARIALACLEILVPLTWPLEHEEMTANHHRHTPYILQAQVKYKAGVLHWDTTSVLRQAIRTALPALAMRRDQRTARDDGIIKLMLYFIRNIAAIRQVPNLPSQGLDHEVSRSATIEAFRAQDVFALLLTMCSNMGEDFNLEDVIILEILFNLIKGVDVEKLWMNETQKKESNISDLKAILDAEANMHREAKKNAPTRHGRFGTMIWVKQDNHSMKAVSGQDNLKDDQTALFNIDNTKKWNKPLQRRKDLEHSIHDFDLKEHLTGTASEQLRNFAEEFLDSGFNPLITHLRKAIEREAERLLPINYRQFFYVVAWFLKAERVRRERKQKDAKSAKTVQNFDPEGYALVAAVLNQETFITLNRYMQMSYDDKSWQDLNSSMRCFTEILHTIQDMAQSPLEEDQDIAENIQNRIFYEETTHDRIISLLKGYKDQGLGYLDACTELAHVFLRLLERYSKDNVDLQIRSKRRARRKQKEATQKQQSEHQGSEQDDGEESEHEDVMDVVQVSKERKFDFKRFAAKFVSQPSVDTFVALLKFYKDLTLEQLKRVHRFLYRVAFKQEQAVLLYRVDIIALLYRLIEGPESLPKKHEMYGEWSEFTKQLFRKLFKKIDQRPELVVEMLFSKISATLYYLEYGHDKTTSTTARAPAELEVNSSVTRDRNEQIGIVVTILLRDDKKELVDWVKKNVSSAYEERRAWEAEAEARRADAETAAPASESEVTEPQPVVDMPAAQPSYITLRADTEDVRIAMFKNARFKLMMKLVGFAQKDDEHTDTSDATWIIPSFITASHLEESKAAINQYTFAQWQPQNEDDVPEDMLRRVRKESTRTSHDYADDAEGGEARRDAFINDSEGDDGPLPEEEEFLFPDNPRKRRSALERLKDKRKAKKRKRGSDNEDGAEDSEDEAVREERRRRRKEAAAARRRKFKSEAFIRDSDDETDEEADKLFFAREAEIRQKHDKKVKMQMAVSSSTAKDSDFDASERKRRAMARLRGDADEDRDVDMDQDENSLPASSQPKRRQRERSSVIGSDDDEDDTPPSSPPAGETSEDDPDDDVGKKAKNHILKELAQARTAATKPRSKMADRLGTVENDSSSDVDVEDEDIVISKATSLRRNRGGFVLDDDDDE